MSAARYYTVRVSWGCLGLACGTALVGAWLAIQAAVVLATVVAEIGAAAHGH